MIRRHPMLRGGVLIAIGVLGGCAAGTDSATDTSSAAGGAIAAEWVADGRIPGAVLRVARSGEVVFEQAYGRARLFEYREGQYGASAAGEMRRNALHRLESPTPMTADTLFDLASLTKVMATTFAVMLLVDDGVLEVDAPVSTYLPDFDAAPESAAAAASPGDKPAITLRHLLTHRSGLSQWQPIYYYAATPAEAYEYVRDLPLQWSVGEERHYSDLGFMLLGLIVERVTGETLGSFLQTRLYGPLGLQTIGFRASGAATGDAATPDETAFAATSHGNPFEHRMVNDLDFGYRIEGDPSAWTNWREHTLDGEVNDGNAFHAFGGMAGHAGLFSGAADLQVLLQLLLNRGAYDGRRFISAAVVDEFLAPTGDGQALGWQVPDYAPAGSFSHTGFTGTYVLGVPAAGTSLVLLTNRQNVGVDDQGQYPDVGELQRAVARAVLETQ